MGNGDEEMNNWTPWCTQNVLLCAFALPFEESVRRRVMEQACRSLDCFLKDYGEDGCCSEGAQYYGHAALCLFRCLRILEIAAPGVFDSIWHEPKIANMASYIYHMHVDGMYYFNFADCSPVAGRRGARDYLFAVRTGNQEMAAFAAGALGEILCEGLTEAPRVEVLSIQDARLRLAWPDTLYRLVLPFSDRISIRIH